MPATSEWQNQVVTNLRFDPVGTSNVDFQVDWIRASDGDYDNDGLSDLDEGDADLDQDGLVSLEDTDRDGDGLPDATDPQPDVNPFDNDQDGIPDIIDPDDDNDGTLDPNDAFPFNPLEQTDTDGDGVGNNSDAFPTNPAEQIDTDGDGVGNNADTDDDGDGVTDAVEVTAGRNPLNPLDLNFGFNTATDFEGWTNRNGIVTSPAPTVSGGTMRGTSNSVTPGDPYFWRSGFTLRGNSVIRIIVKMKVGTAGGSMPAGNAQFFWGRAGATNFAGSRSVAVPFGAIGAWSAVVFNPSANAEWMNNTITTLRIDPHNTLDTPFEIDWIRASNGDLDGDGIADATEGTGDLDGDGLLNIEDLDSDADGLPDATDPQPYINTALDFDGDGILNAVDPDDDNDGAMDSADAFPLNADEQLDSDLDGIGNNADPDDDNDLTPDAGDAFPLDPAEQFDNDLDGIGDNADLDDDNDGTPDLLDAFPFDTNEQLDTDLDGIGNNTDTDDDNDGLPDAVEIPIGLSPLVPIDPTADTDGDGQTDLLEAHAGTDRTNNLDRFEWSVVKPSALATQIGLAVKPGRAYRILAGDSLLPSDWQIIETLSPTSTFIHTFTDPSNLPRRFYRVEIKVAQP
jgi:hypothetical protein